MPRLLSLIAFVCYFLVVYKTACAQPPPYKTATKEALRAVVPPDSRFEDLGNGYAAVIPLLFANPTPAIDPVYKFSTRGALYLYEKELGKESMLRRVVVHFDPDDRDAAVRAVRLVARILLLHRRHFNRETIFPRAAPVANVWFTPTPPQKTMEGGETRDANVYIFAASTIRSSIELVRTVAHEWGHLTLPGARGFSAPENDAAGYLGERLYIHYLLLDSLGRTTPYADDGTTRENLRLYYDRQIAPLMLRWQKGGPSNKILNGDQTESMDYYIGGVLDSDRSFGSQMLGDALFRIGDTAARDFLVALKAVVAERLASGLSVNLPAWMPVPQGAYQAVGVSGGGLLTMSGRRSVRVEVEGDRNALPSKPGARREGRFRVTATDWYKAVSPSGSLAEVSLKSLGTTR